ncbi:aldehyde dehydrogenase [Arthrobacter sp. MYb211]|uniref:aldehyde dehydrogenase family protein n=1 Tax=unclassified Arthrobacter TaxID=235627 RepID=UPI000CFD1DDC|nr:MULTISPECIES: aldehyde dehydrogenase family protein [unclassified Arthrobacter]PRA12356.1 aldehyde dehydrogenase [Arthrobacter sp. MYb221]PRC08819.1 aldehyde dehydrogenase [Arthrobacter sp. MYb211]
MTNQAVSSRPNFLDQLPAQLFIAGQWRDGRSSSVLVTRNPFDDAVLAEIRQASIEDVDEAYSSAAQAQRDWAALIPAKRAAVLTKAADYLQANYDDLVALLVAESGSSVLKANVEVSGTISATREAATFPTRVHGQILPSNSAGKENRVYREPVGVVGVISPWNFPMLLSQRSVAPALALGNSVVLKPASDTPLVGALVLAKAFEAAGIPRGVFSVVVGSGTEIGDHFVAHSVPSLISFTGSTPVGKNVGKLAVSGKHMKRVALELGGNAPFVVLADANLEQAVRAAAMGKFLHQGQICMAINRIIVQAPVYDQFVEQFAAHAATIKYGDAAEPANVVGPIINDAQLASVQGKIAQARNEGAREVLSGEVVGRVVPPHVFADVTSEMELFREEIFGPVVGITRAEDEAHALELANDTEFGLSSAVFTTDIEKGVRFARGIKAGMTHINDITVNDEPHVMFGGEKNSGSGRFNGEWAIEEFTTDHWVGVQSTDKQYPF